MLVPESASYEGLGSLDLAPGPGPSPPRIAAEREAERQVSDVSAKKRSGSFRPILLKSRPRSRTRRILARKIHQTTAARIIDT